MTAYRQAMAAFPCGCGLPFVLTTQKPPGFAQMPTMDLWYAHLDEDQLMSSIRAMMDETSKKAKEAKKKKLHKKDVEQEKLVKRAEKRAVKPATTAHTRDSMPERPRASAAALCRRPAELLFSSAEIAAGPTWSVQLAQLHPGAASRAAVGVVCPRQLLWVKARRSAS